MLSESARIIGNPLTELCGIRLPLLQGALPGFSGPSLVAAVSEAGGLGTLTGFDTCTDTLRRSIQQTQRLTRQPFAVYLMPQLCGYKAFRAAVKVVAECRPAVLVLTYGYYGDALRQAREAGVRVLVQVRSADEGRKALRHGAQGLIAQGQEAAGFIPGDIGLMALLPELISLDKSVPVIAAGSIHDGAAVRGMLAMGAAGVCITAGFAVSEESTAGAKVRRKLLAAASTPEHLCCEPVPAAEATPGLLRRFLYSRSVVAEDDQHPLRFYWGQGLGQLKQVLPAAELVKALSSDFCQRR